MNLDFLSNSRFWIVLFAGLGLAGSFVNYVIIKLVSLKITQNDLKHIEADITKLEKEKKETKSDIEKIKEDIFNEIHKVHLTTRRIENKVSKREGICEARKEDIKDIRDRVAGLEKDKEDKK
jgi:septal ring factor EnvC (AmiA/AmiB activator)